MCEKDRKGRARKIKEKRLGKEGLAVNGLLWTPPSDYEEKGDTEKVARYIHWLC